MEKIMKKILALTLAMLMLILPLSSCKRKKKEEVQSGPPAPAVPAAPLFDLNLSEYIYIDPASYKNISVEIKVNAITDSDVDALLRQIRVANKYLVEDQNVVLEEGHIVSIFYRGYLDGELFDGGSNWDSKSGGYVLDLGSGESNFGFEDNMIGKRPCDYSKENPMVIDARFPDDYHDTKLAGKSVTFDVAVEIRNEKLQVYEAPELTETFIKDTLRFTDEYLASYAGNDTVEKYRSYLYEKLKWDGVDVDTAVKQAINNKIWNSVVVMKYPEAQLKEAYDAKVSEIQAKYQANESLQEYYTFDQYACSYFGISSAGNWRTAAENAAKDEVKIKLIIYHIMDLEGLKPSAAEYEKLLDQYITDVLESEGNTIYNYDTEEEFYLQKEQKKSMLTTKYGEHYLKSKIYENLWIEAMIKYANIIEIV